MREEIEKILARLAPTAEESSHITGSEPFYAIKESDLPELTDQILTLLDKSLPGERPLDGVLYSNRKLRAMNGIEGWNACLQEIKEKLK